MSGEIPYVADHANRALSRLPKMFGPTGSVAGLVECQAKGAQDIEDGLFAMIAASAVATAIGGQLDVLGKVVGQQRGGLDDDVYRLYVLARIRLNRGIVPAPRLQSTAVLVNPTSHAFFTNYPPAGFRLLITGPADHGLETAQLLKSGVAAGVNGEVVWEDSAPAATFTLDSGPGLDVGHLAGSL